MLKVFIASDHAGVEMKKKILRRLAELGFEGIDFGTDTAESVDFPDFSSVVCTKVQAGEGLGILICGTGIGMSMAANKVRGIRAALCVNDFMAEATRAHNDANILCLGARVVDDDIALKIVEKFLSTDFEGGRHIARIAKMMAHEGK